MMYKKFTIIFLFILAIFFVPSFSLQAEEGWRITNFHSHINIEEDGGVLVVEKIDVDFGSLQRHGIFRDIPYIYQSDDGGKIYTDVAVLEVTDNNGNNIPYELSESNGFVSLKIGDAQKIISGEQFYAISYRVLGVLSSFADYDELYWNVTGDWSIPIDKGSAVVVLPKAGIIQTSCYVGEYGSTAECSKEESGGRIASFASVGLGNHKGFTVAVGYKKNMVPILVVEGPKGLVFSVLTYITFGITFILGLIYLMRLWRRSGRDKWWRRKSLHDPNTKVESMPVMAHETIVAEYESPKKLRPAEIGVIMDERADTLDVSATIVDLAVRGYLEIVEEKKKIIFIDTTEYTFVKKKESDSSLKNYEKELLKALFRKGDEVKLSSLKNSFYKDLKIIKKELYKEVVSLNLFAGNPQSIRTKYTLWAVGVMAGGAVITILGFISMLSFLIGIGLGLDVIGIMFIFTAQFMPRRTAHGREMYRRARGYKLFIDTAEKHRQQFFEKENTFMEVLPYAIVFGATKKLANTMKVMGVEPPQPGWYRGSRPFNAYLFASGIDSFSRSLSKTISSSPSGSGSGGGGFSGGGFGGGGGGSW